MLLSFCEYTKGIHPPEPLQYNGASSAVNSDYDAKTFYNFCHETGSMGKTIMIKADRSYI
jgi:hypothetical protein